MYKFRTIRLSAIFKSIFLCATLFGCIHQSAHSIKPILETQFYDNIIVPITINQHTYHFLLDTGASVTVIDDKLANKITKPIELTNLPSVYQDSFESIHTVSSKVSSDKLTLLKPVSYFIGDYEINDNDLWLSSNLDLLSQAVGLSLDGIIGIETFRKFSWHIDNDKHQLTIFKDSPSAALYEQCIGYEDSINKGPYFYLDYKNSLLRLMTDTGASESYLDADFINFLKDNHSDDIQLSRENMDSVDMNGQYSLDSYIISGLVFNNMPLGEIAIDKNNNHLYALGMDFFSRFQRYVFIPNRMMFCYDAKTLAKQQLMPVRNIALRYFNHHIEIFHNQDNKLTQFGLHNGDVIEKVNSIVYLPAQIGQVRDLFALTAVGQLTLQINRQGELLTIVL